MSHTKCNAPQRWLLWSPISGKEYVALIDATFEGKTKKWIEGINKDVLAKVFQEYFHSIGTIGKIQEELATKISTKEVNKVKLFRNKIIQELRKENQSLGKMNHLLITLKSRNMTIIDGVTMTLLVTSANVALAMKMQIALIPMIT